MGEISERHGYGRAYCERVQLSDGEHAQLRMVRPSDKQLLRDGFERLSSYSRYQRFMTAKKVLTEAELRYLTELDGVDHVAIVAVRPSSGGQAEAIGVARFIRLRGQEDTAEPAVTVADDHQGKGLGSMLLQRLAEAAWERDIRRFSVELFAENTASRRMFASLSPEARFSHSGAGTMVVTLPIPEPTMRSGSRALFRRTPIYRLLSHVARASMSRVRRRVA